MRLRVICLLFVVIIISACKHEQSEIEYIAVNDNNDIHLLNIQGKIEHTIHLPNKITYDFYLDSENVYFYSEDKKLHVYDWRNQKEKEVISGPFFFKSKNYGPEIYHKITVSGNLIAFFITPEYFNSLGNPEEIRNKYPFEEMLDETRVGVFDLNNKIISLLPLQEGYRKNQILYKETLISSGGGLSIYNIRSNTYNYIYHIKENNIYNKAYHVSLLGKYYSKIYYAFYDYKMEDNIIYRINCWDIDNKTEKNIYDFSNKIIGEEIYGIIDDRSRISKDLNKLIWIDDDNNITIYNLSIKRKEIIYSAKNIEKLKMQFYYDKKHVVQ